MSIGSILIIGVALLSFGCGGLLLVRFEDPHLLGLGWLGAALGTGGTGALLLLLNGRKVPFLSILFADLLVLASLVLLHLAMMEIAKRRGVPLIPFLLLILQAAADLYKIYAHASPYFRITVIGFLAASQAIYTVFVLLRHPDRAIRSPARFISLVLTAFSTWNLLRSFAINSGFLAERALDGQMQAFTTCSISQSLSDWLLGSSG